MKAGKTADVRRACAEFLAETSKFYQTPSCGIRVLAARPLRVREHWTIELFGDYHPETHADPFVDANGGAQGSHVIWDVSEHALPRVLPSSRFSPIWFLRLVAYTGFLRAYGGALPSCERNAAETTLLGSSAGWTLADRLASDESGSVSESRPDIEG